MADRDRELELGDSGGSAAGGLASHLIGWAFDKSVEVIKERKAEDLANRMAEQMRQSMIAPISTPAAVTAPAATVEAIPAVDPLQEALAGLRVDEGEPAMIPPAPTAPASVSPIKEAAAVPSPKSESDIFKDEIAKQAAASQAIQAQEGGDITSAYTASINEAARIYPPDENPEEYQQLVDHLARMQGDMVLDSQAKMISDTFNAAGGRTTPGMIKNLGQDNVDKMYDRVAASQGNIEIVDRWGMTERNIPGSEPVFVNKDTQEVIGPVFPDQGLMEHVQTTRTVDVNASVAATSAGLANTRLRNAVQFVEGAHEISKLLTAETVMGSSVAFLRGAESWLRSASALIGSELESYADPDGTNAWDPDDLDDGFFKGLTFINEKTRGMLSQDANLRSLYAHLAIMYFRAQHPQAKSLSKDNLKLTMTALGGNLNDPEQMRQVLRTISNRVVKQAAGSSAGYIMDMHDPYVSTVFGPKAKIDISKSGLPYDSAYYLNPEALYWLNLTDEAPIKPGQTVSEAAETPVGKMLIGTWYDAKTGAVQKYEQIEKRMFDAGLENMTIEELNNATFDSAYLADIKHRLGLVNEPPEPDVIQVNPAVSSIMTEEGVAALMEQWNAKGAREGKPPITLGPAEDY